MDATFIIPLRRHVRTVVYINAVTLAFFCSGLATVKSNSLLNYCIFWSICYLLITVYSFCHRFYDFPVRINIHEDYLEVDCRVLFIFQRKYCWRKEDIKISNRNTTELIKFRNITIYNKSKRGGGIQFDMIAVKGETLDDILEALIINGYEIKTR